MRQSPCALVSPKNPHKQSSTILSCNRRAASLGLAPGLSTTRALARCPTLQILPRSPDAEATALRLLLQFAESHSPDFELTNPDTLILSNTQASPIFDTLPSLGLPAQLASGPTPDLAHLASLSPQRSHCLLFHGPNHRWKPISSRPSHSPLSLAQKLPQLGFQSSDIALLQQWGLHTLEQFSALPRQGLIERLGPPAARLHDLLHAKSQRLLRLFSPIKTFDSIIPLEQPISFCQPLVLLIEQSLQTLCTRLHSSYHLASEIVLQLELENQAPHYHRVRLPEPSILPATLLAPLATHLEQLQLPAPVTALQLTLTPCLPQAGQQQLFGQEIRNPHRLADTLTRLTALLGEPNIGFPIPHFTHRPDRFHLRPAHSLFSAQTSPKTRPSSPPLYPLSRFRPPLEISVSFEGSQARPQPLALLTGPHPGRIIAHHGPFPISGQWWDPGESWQQLEWDIQLESHHLLRLSHTPPDRWELQGQYS